MNIAVSASGLRIACSACFRFFRIYFFVVQSFRCFFFFRFRLSRAHMKTCAQLLKWKQLCVIEAKQTNTCVPSDAKTVGLFLSFVTLRSCFLFVETRVANLIFWFISIEKSNRKYVNFRGDAIVVIFLCCECTVSRDAYINLKMLIRLLSSVRSIHKKRFCRDETETTRMLSCAYWFVAKARNVRQPTEATTTMTTWRRSNALNAANRWNRMKREKEKRSYERMRWSIKDMENTCAFD